MESWITIKLIWIFNIPVKVSKCPGAICMIKDNKLLRNDEIVAIDKGMPID